MTTNKKKNVTAKSKKKKAWGSKQVLASPFAPTFPSPDPSTRSAMLEILLDIFPVPFAQRISRPRPTNLKKNPVGDTVIDSPKADLTPKKESPRDGQAEKCKKPPGLLCGVNEVSRALEKDLVDVVVVSRDVVPSIMISHIPVLCYLRSAKLVIMPGNGAEIGSIFGTRRLLAFAIRRDVTDDSDENDLAKRLSERLTPLATKLDYPWLAAAKGGPVPPVPKPVMILHRTKKEIC